MTERVFYPGKHDIWSTAEKTEYTVITMNMNTYAWLIGGPGKELHVMWL